MGAGRRARGRPSRAGLLAPDEPPPRGLVPDIAVEVSSPSTRRIDLVHKRRLYERAGVRECWFVDRGAGVIDVHRFGEPDDLRSATGDRSIPRDLVPPGATVSSILSW